MDISIKEILNNYNNILMQMKILEDDIQYYDDILKLPDLSEFEYYKEVNFLGLKYISPIFSIVEKQAFSKEHRHKLNHEIVFLYRNKKRKKLLKLKKQIKIIKSAVRLLDREDKYIIECKFLHSRKLTYRDIATNFYTQWNKYLDERSIKRRVKVAIEKIEKNIQIADVDLNKTLNLNKNYLKL